MTLSGSLVFTLKIGTPNGFTISDEFLKLRSSSGLVVKPTWLFVIICRLPSQLNLGNLLKVKASYEAPYPGKAASPCA